MTIHPDDIALAAAMIAIAGYVAVILLKRLGSEPDR
jgi:hypothetical protein